MNDRVVIFAGSQGGHFVELMALHSLFDKFYSVLVTDNPDATYEKTNMRVFQGIEHSIAMFEHRKKKAGNAKKTGRLQNISSYCKMFKECWAICEKWQPSIIVSTGSYIAVPLFIYAKFHGAKTIFIESNAKVYQKTMTGILVEHFSDKIYVQWPEMLKLYPQAEYYGPLI